MTLNWEPRIGDPTFVGWATVVAFFATAGLCVATARLVAVRVPGEHAGRQALIWRMVALLLIALGINKQLDLQGLLVAIGRAVAERQGWYEDRRRVQFLFILVVLGISATGFMTLLWGARRRLKEYGWLLAGTATIIAFIVVRAVSFHHFQEFFSFPIGGVKIHRLLELSAIALLAVAALKRLHELQHASA
jgi:hypothetical protein